MFLYFSCFDNKSVFWCVYKFTTVKKQTLFCCDLSQSLNFLSRAMAIVAKIVISTERFKTSGKSEIPQGVKLRRKASKHTRAMLMPMLKPILSMISSFFCREKCPYQGVPRQQKNQKRTKNISGVNHGISVFGDL